MSAATDAAQTASPSVRLSVNVTPEVSENLKTTARTRGLTVTEAVRTAINLFKLISDELSKGNKIIIQEGEGPRARQRELTFVLMNE